MVASGLALRALGQEVIFFDRGEKGNPLRDRFFTDDELKADAPAEGAAFRQHSAGAVLKGS